MSLNLLWEVAKEENITVHFSASPTAIDFTAQCMTLQDMGTVAQDHSPRVLVQLPAPNVPLAEIAATQELTEGNVDVKETAHEVKGSLRHGQERKVGAAAVMDVSSNDAAAWSTALAMHAQGSQANPVPPFLEYDLLIGADGASSKVCLPGLCKTFVARSCAAPPALRHFIADAHLRHFYPCCACARARASGNGLPVHHQLPPSHCTVKA